MKIGKTAYCDSRFQEGPTQAYGNPYYIGADPLRPGWAKATLEEVFEQGCAMLAKDPTRQEVFIVQIIKVLKRAPEPVLVCDVVSLRDPKCEVSVCQPDSVTPTC